MPKNFSKILVRGKSYHSATLCYHCRLAEYGGSILTRINAAQGHSAYTGHVSRTPIVPTIPPAIAKLQPHAASQAVGLLFRWALQAAERSGHVDESIHEHHVNGDERDIKNARTWHRAMPPKLTPPASANAAEPLDQTQH